MTTALTSLRERGITRIVYSSSNRAPKHRHVLPELLGLDDGERAALTVLLLRGAQTVGEVKGRTERLHPFDDLRATEDALETLARRGLAVRLGRRPGQKEERYAQLLGGPPDEAEEAGLSSSSSSWSSASSSAASERGADGPSRADRLASLEQRVAELEERLGSLTERLGPLLDE